MALNTPGGHAGVTKIKVMRENGDKKGQPFIFQRIDQLPAQTEGRKFETRKAGDGSNVHYELFKSVSGFVAGVRIEEQEFGGEAVRTLVVRLIDGPDLYDLHVGKLDGRMSLDLIKRLLNPVFRIDLRSTLMPYVIANDGKENTGVSVQNGGDKISYNRESDYLRAFPDAEHHTEFDGKVLWSFKRQAHALFQAAEARFNQPFEKKTVEARPIPSPDYVFPQTERPAQAEPVTGAAAFPTEPAPVTDDLPF